MMLVLFVDLLVRNPSTTNVSQNPTNTATGQKPTKGKVTNGATTDH